jgi:hypothetical protein
MKHCSSGHRRGSAVLIVLALLGALCLLLLGNAATLRSLKRELRLIEEQQWKRWTNAPARSTR